MGTTYRHTAARFATIVAAPLLFLLAPAGFTADSGDCADCHDDVHVETGAHSEIECTECHSNIEAVPHDESNYGKLPGDQSCAQCHDSADPLSTSVHSDLVCGDCHGGPHGLAESGEAVCADCHRKADRLVGRSVHAGETQCIDCHLGSHSVVASADSDSPVASVNQIKTCGACHQQPADVIDGYLTSVHGKALLLSGVNDAPGCTDCHDSHEVLAVYDENWRDAYSNSPEMCGSCHALTLTVWAQAGAHGQAWKQGNQESPLCTTCHKSHGFVSPQSNQPRLDLVENCGDCHIEYYTTYRDSFHGKATDLQMTAAATCADCHKSHQNLPADDRASSVHPDSLSATCGACHGKTSAGFLSFDPHADAADREKSPQVYYVRLFMGGLLIAVFGFFAFHDTLWLQRTLVGMARGEFQTTSTDGPYVRRFSETNIRLHMIVVLTFLLLAATGLPLKFHWMSWAQPMVNFFGGLESARTIHRLAAIGTFGYAAFHLANIFIRSVRNEKGLFWGFDSLVPQWQDVTDLLQNLRYFLYLGPRPAGTKWSYWEKFDYMAVFWGIPIIGLSGLLLWYPKLSSQIFPGWVLNAAHVIHSEEALLATGFIFVFHFFHTHMRPESFPMDPVIFTGRMSLERFKEERPLEYQRLADRNELDTIAAEPPTRSELRNAHIIGFSAMAVGIVLAFAIFWSFVNFWMS